MDATDPLARIVVCDAGPLIHLDQLACLDLLQDFAGVLVPSTVWSEVSRHRPGALTRYGALLKQVQVSKTLPEDLEAVSRLLSLDRGEVEALQLVRERNADLLLSDDTAARLAAKQLNIRVHGTLGIVVRAIRRGQRTAPEAVAVLRAVRTASTLHVKPALLDEIIREVEELP